MIGDPARPFFLSEYEEVVGILHEVDEKNSYAKVSACTVILPLDVIAALKPHLGKRVSILRTDELERPYRWRTLKL